MSWEATSRRVIQEVIAANPDLPEKELRKKISETYPFGERAMWPYKVWLKEVNRAMGRIPQSQIEWPEWLRGGK